MAPGGGYEEAVGVEVTGSFEETSPVFMISVAAELAGMHAQTLRQYDRLGLVTPHRAVGRGRRYSARDIVRLREVQRLSQEDGVNLAGVKRILELENQVDQLRDEVAELMGRLEQAHEALQRSRRVFAAGPGGDVVAMQSGRRPARSPLSSRSALVVWRPHS